MDMVWKMPKDQREGGGGGGRAAPQIYFKVAEERRGTSIFLPFPAPPPALRRDTSPERTPALPPPNPALPVFEGGSERV